MLYEVVPLAILIALLNSMILAALHWSVIDHGIILSWLAALWLISAYRFLQAMRFRTQQPTTPEIGGWATKAQTGVILSGICWGAASYFLFAEASLPHQVFLALVVTGMSAGAVTILSHQRWASSVFVLLALLPLIYRFSQQTHEFAISMSLLALIFISMMLPVAARLYCNLKEMLTERFERQLTQLREQARNQVLEMLAKGAPLSEILKAIVLGLENENPDMIGSILLLAEDEKHLVTGSSPSLPTFYNEAINGLEIGEGGGSCGTAAYIAKRVIVEDIQTHPYWDDYRQLAAKAGLGACWSEPIIAANGKLLGTFAIYHHYAQTPSEQELSIIEHAANLAEIAIEHHQAHEELRLAILVYQNSSEAVMILNSDNRIVATNPAFIKITGYSLQEVIGKDPMLLNTKQQDRDFHQKMSDEIIATGQWQGEVWNRRKDGTDYAVWLTIDTIFDATGKVQRRVALFSDITANKKADAMIWDQAHRDTLTGLPNRRLFFDRLEQGIKTAHRDGDRLALLFIDLDRFKEVNDAFGHHLGDKLLVEAGRRIKNHVRESDTVARVGGDEFTAILPELNDATDAGRISQGIIEALNKPFILDDETAFISASIGITVYPDDAVQVQELMKNADQAMYTAKQAGRSRFSYFTSSMQENAQQRMHLVQDMRSALVADEFSVHYQPIVDLATNSILKAEALLRWNHPQHGFISPATFIPIAEETGIINGIGDWVFKEAARQIKEWRSIYHPDFQISINRSPMQFLAENQMKDCQLDWVEYLQEISLPGEAIVIEITEGVLLNAAANINEKLIQFRDAGIQVAIDDFGTGYSSLSYLKRFDIDYLKIDQSFINNLEMDAIDLALSEAIVVMAHKLGFRVIAEGVETEAQRNILKRIGCDYAQGYLFSKPLQADIFEALFFKNKNLATLLV